MALMFGRKKKIRTHVYSGVATNATALQNADGQTEGSLDVELGMDLYNAMVFPGSGTSVPGISHSLLSEIDTTYSTIKYYYEMNRSSGSVTKYTDLISNVYLSPTLWYIAGQTMTETRIRKLGNGRVFCFTTSTCAPSSAGFSGTAYVAGQVHTIFTQDINTTPSSGSYFCFVRNLVGISTALLERLQP